METQPSSLPLLAQLRPNHSPDPVGIWPPAIGWWFISTLAVVLLIVLSIFIWRLWKTKRYRAHALKQASRIFTNYHNHTSVHQLAYESNELLKRVALQSYPRCKVASLTGVLWSQFLAHSANMPEFLNHSGFNNDRYNPTTHLVPENIYKLTRQWIKKHHVEF